MQIHFGSPQRDRHIGYKPDDSPIEPNDKLQGGIGKLVGILI